jgi:hypothetical protein
MSSTRVWPVEEDDEQTDRISTTAAVVVGGATPSLCG